MHLEPTQKEQCTTYLGSNIYILRALHLLHRAKYTLCVWRDIHRMESQGS